MSDAQPELLSSGNPRIPKGDGDAPVQAYIAAMPGWKQAIGREIDRMVGEVFPDARKAVNWNTPLYGNADGWFMAIYCYKRHVQITFMRGTSLNPMPPVPSRTEGTRYLKIYEEGFDRAQMADWIRQASSLPGVRF